jgi:hypothetical protein
MRRGIVDRTNKALADLQAQVAAMRTRADMNDVHLKATQAQSDDLKVNPLPPAEAVAGPQERRMGVGEKLLRETFGPPNSELPAKETEVK